MRSKHNPGDFDKEGNQTAYNWREMEYYIPPYISLYKKFNVPDLEVMTDIGPTFIMLNTM